MSLFGRSHPDVLVIGAGPVGQFAALSLSRRNVAVQVVDEEWRTAGHSYALALHGRSIRLLEEEGLAGGLLQNARVIDRIGLYDYQEKRAEVDLKVLETPYIAVLPQSHLEETLETALKKRGIEVLWNHHVAAMEPGPRGIEIVVDRLEQESLGYSVAHTEWVVARSTRLQVPYVIGADGHLSDVRRSLGIRFNETAPARYYAVFEFKTDVELESEIPIILGDGGAAVCWPLPDGRCRWSFELTDTEEFAKSRHKDRVEVEIGNIRYPVLSEERLHTFLEERAPWFKGKIEEIVWRLVVRFEYRLASSFGSGRVWLAGDAAHMTGPVGIQSMNVGLHEAHELAEAFAGTPGKMDSILSRYNDTRMAEWRKLLGLGVPPVAEAGADPWVARYADVLPGVLPAAGRDLERLLASLQLRYTA